MTAAQLAYYEDLCAEHRLRMELRPLIRHEAAQMGRPQEAAALEDRALRRMARARTLPWWVRASRAVAGRPTHTE